MAGCRSAPNSIGARPARRAGTSASRPTPGNLVLSGGGSRLVCDDRILVDEKPAEYRGIYRRFVELIANGESDVDLSPLVHVADAFMLGRRRDVEPFMED